MKMGNSNLKINNTFCIGKFYPFISIHLLKRETKSVFALLQTLDTFKQFSEVILTVTAISSFLLSIFEFFRKK